jgi:hypothetical protein
MRRAFDLRAVMPTAISCRLSSDELAERRTEWETVRAHVDVVERNRFPGGFRMVVQGRDDVLDEVARLVAAERKCCSWASWELETRWGQATLTVSGEEELIAPLAQAMFAS